MSELTPDLSEFEERHATKAGKCLIGRYLDEVTELFTEQDQANVEAALADPRWTHASIVAYLNKRGRSTSDHTVRQHRNKRCSCAKAAASA